MKSAKVCLLSLACVGGALAFGLAANAAIDLVMPMPEKSAAAVASVPVAKPAEQAQAQPATAYTLASMTSTPVDFAPIKVKTIPMVYREERAEPAVPERIAAAVPLPRPRPASAPAAVAMGPATESIAHRPGTMAIAAATRKADP